MGRLLLLRCLLAVLLLSSQVQARPLHAQLESANQVQLRDGTGSGQPGYSTLGPAAPAAGHPAQSTHVSPVPKASPVQRSLQVQRLTDAASTAADVSAVPARKLPVTSQARAITSPASASRSATGPMVRQLVAQESETAGGCPSVHAAVSAPGCTCTLYRPTIRAHNRSGSSDRVRVNVCPAGYRCSPTDAAALRSAGWIFTRNVTSTPAVDFTRQQGVCISCQLGEYCPPGSQEETPLSLSACDLQVRGANNPTAGGGTAVAQASAQSRSCSGVKLCPAGSYCPSAAEQLPCAAGRWCAEGSIKSMSCNISGLLVWNPFMKAPGGSQLLLEALVKAARPLDGNSCPMNATNPLQGCPPGYYCPTAAEQLPCPVGFYCPGYTTAPVACPVLGSCTAKQASAPEWSYVGVALTLLVLLMLLLLLELLKVSGRCRRKLQSQEDDVMQLIEAVGFKMVGSHGSYQVSRTAHSPSEAQDSSIQLQQLATGLQSAQAVRPSRLPRHRAPAHLTGLWRRWHQGEKPGAAAGPATVTAPAGMANGDHAVLMVGELPDAQHKPEGRFAWLRGWRSQRPRQSGQSIPHPNPSMWSPFEQPAARGNGHTSKPAAAPMVRLTVPSKGRAGDVHGGDDGSGSEEPSENYSINPRLTLLFRDVWVADIPIEEGLVRRAKLGLRELCRRRGTTACHSFSSGRGFDSGGTPACSTTALADMYAKLEGAAAAGAYFIVPGVSSRFAHSQLHAIMGPSGCGKTTLCKALAGRLPQGRMCGDVRLLCSSAADGFKAAVELTALGSMGSAAAACNISHMTGFVPQFDQLHECLTVFENLLLATKLRLPVTGQSDGLDAAGCMQWQRRRHRELHKVVGEVMALMALTKVASTVVGSSSDRTLSGGQRKRVAIGVELVSKPSLLWLDEPTSGLDAAVAYDVVAALKASSERGMNVLAVMHQPRRLAAVLLTAQGAAYNSHVARIQPCSIFHMVDSCLLLGSSGNVVYSGPQRLALPYMTFLGFYIPPRENSADFLLDIMAGVVPRPGDPDYIPSQLATIWHKAGGIWVQQQLRREQQLQEHNGLQPADAHQLTELLPNPPPAVDTPVDWPWQPRDLEALLSRFSLLVEGGPSGQVPRRGGFHSAEGHGSVLSYDGFLTFWDGSGVKELLGEEQFAVFIEGLCDDFGIKPDSTITRAQFIQVLKDQLRAAAAAAAGLPDDALLLSSAHSMPLHTITSGDPDPASGTGLAASTTNGPLRQPATADSSGDALDDLGRLQPARQAAQEKAEDALRKHEAAAATRQASAAACDDAAASEAAEAAVFDAAAAACQADRLTQAAAEGCPTTAAAGASGCGLVDVAPACTPSCTPAHTPAQLSRTCSSAAAFSHGDHHSTFAPGVLTCPQARLQQHALMQQRMLNSSRRSSRRGPEGVPDVISGPSGTAGADQHQEPCQQQREQQQKGQQHMEALRKCRKSWREALEAAAQQPGLRQLSQACVMRAGSSTITPTAADRPLCTSLQEARSRCLDQLGDFLVQQQSQQQPGQQSWPAMCAAAGAATMPHALQRHRSGHSGHLVQQLPQTPEGVAADADTRQLAASSGSTVAAGGPSGGVTPAPAAAVVEAAAAAVSLRKLPSRWKQLQAIMRRSVWKAVLDRSALMTDLLLTSVLGLALGVAEGRQTYPGSSLTWMVITMLAYGCITLVRSTRSYGTERHIYLQQESPAGVSVTAWVFGHQVIDLVGLLLHPVLFFAWMYVLKFTPVPAWSYLTTLMAVGIYTSGLGYLVSLTVNPANAMVTGLALALLLGGVVNGVMPPMWQLDATHPLVWLNYLSYTRWALQAMYIGWLIPASGAAAPTTATFLSGLGFCGLQPSLVQALSGRSSTSTGITFNATTLSGQEWWNMTSAQRASALADAGASTLRDSPAENQTAAAASAAITRLWQFHNHPHLLNQQCQVAQGTAIAVLVGLGLLCRLLVYGLVKFKVARKAQE